MTKANECTCPSGDGSLRHPCPAHPASAEQAGGDERVIGWRERILAAHPNSDPDFWPDALLVEHMAAEIADLRAALAQPSPKCATCNDRGHVCLDWEAGAWEKCPDCAQAGERSPMAVMAEALRDKARQEQQEYQDRRAQVEAERPELWAVHAQGPDELYAAFSREDAEKHAAELNALPMPEGIAVGAVVVPSPWPEAEHWKYLAEQEREHVDVTRAGLTQPSPAPELAERGTQHRFSTTEQTCRHDFAGVWWNDNGETKTGRECRHCGFFVADVTEAPAEQAEAERPEVVAYFDRNYPSTGDAFIWSNYEGSPYEPVMTVAQHDRIVGELRADRDSWAEQAEQRLADWDEMRKERDAALARVAELELGIARIAGDFLPDNSGQAELALDEMRQALHELLAAAPTQAQHSVPEKVRTLLSRAQCEIEHLAECLENVCEDEEYFDVREDVADGRVVAADIAHMLAAAPGKEGV
ncbi:TPA: hypothetical protein SL417_004389 [Pseudomonas aeruginosa]|nr:hypothetical protein [Pseudomonas aeruginosa]HEQ0048771.1 hypothetical protein [Pseudomonas aeruginosa]